MIGDFFYAIEVYETEGVPLSPSAIERRLFSAVQDYDSLVRAGEKAPPVGVLTSDERDSWAAVRTFSLPGDVVLTGTCRITLTCDTCQATISAYSI